MAGGMKRHMDRRLPSTFKIQITSMVDMFVILLVFLLKSYSTSPVNIAPGKNLTLPKSSAVTDPQDVLKLIVSKEGVFVDDDSVLQFKNGELAKEDLDPNDASFIPKLFKQLDDKAKNVKEITKLNALVEFDGRVLVQADKDMPYSLLQKVMYTSMLAGYANVKLAVASKDF
jgi:biopolymer transport protein ExbD